MGSPIKINSISIDLAGAADEIDAGKCEHFSIRGFVAEIRERDHRKCWPFSADTVVLGDQQSYSLPSLSVLKSRWWRCPSCIRDINAKDINGDCRLQPHSMSTTEKKLDACSSAIPNKRKLSSLIVTDKNEKRNDNQKATLLKKVRGRGKDASTVKSKSNKLAIPEQVNKRSKEKPNISTEIGWKESQEAVDGGETMEPVTAFGSSDIAGVIDDTPDKAVKKNDRYRRVLAERDECDNVSPECRNLLGLHRRKTRKVRLLSELLSDRNKDTLSKRESVLGKKSKSSENEDCRHPAMTNYASRILSTIGKTSGNASKSCDSEDNAVSGAESRPSAESHSTDSGIDEDSIKGKQRNRRFQVVEERFLETSQKDTYDYFSLAHSSFPGKELVPCTLHTQRTEKDLSLAKKRKRKAIIDNKKSTMITFSNNVDDGNLVKLRTPDNFTQAGPRNTMPQSTGDLLNSKWRHGSFGKLSASDGHSNKFTPQLDDRPVFPFPLQEEMRYKDNDCAMLKGIGTNHFQYFGSSYKSSNVDGCLRTGVHVDFSSNKNTTRPSTLNDKLRQTSFTEVAGSSCALQKDISQAQGKGKEVVVQEFSTAPRFQKNHRPEKKPEHIDDIPMEIVELMAKNQYERCLPDREEDKQPSQTTTSVSKNALLIDLNETYDNSMENTLRQSKPLGMNARNGDELTKEAYFMTGKQNSLEFFPTSQFGQPYNVPSGLGTSALTRDNHSSSIQFSGVVRPNRQSSHNCQWLGSVPTTMANHQNQSPSSFRVLRPCKTCQTVQQQQYKEASHPIWPSSITTSHAHGQVSLSMSQKCMDHQSTKLDNPNTRNLNFVDNWFEGSSSKSSDIYPNESNIPAMHLLSLMDPRLRSNIPVGQSQNTKIVERPFSPVHQPKDLIGSQPGGCNKIAYSTKQWPFDFSSTRVAPETSRESLAIIPPVGTSSISFQSEKSSAENANFNFQASWNHHQEKQSKRKNNNVEPVDNNNHHQKPIFPSSNIDPRRFRLLGASDSMALPLKFHMTDNAKKHKTTKAQSNNVVSACPPTGTSGPFVCSVNRNPADFTIPDAPGNVYMIKGEDLKVRKHAGFKKKPSLCKLKQNKKFVTPATQNA